MSVEAAQITVTDSDDEVVDGKLVDGQASIEAMANGKPVDLFAEREPCQHRGNFGLDCLGAVILDDLGDIASREVRVRVRCMECGVPCEIDFDAFRRPRDGEPHGVILVVTPIEDS